MRKLLFILSIMYICIPVLTITAQEIPSYGFVSFDDSSDSLLSRARSEGYEVKEEEQLSSYGSSVAVFIKDQQFYGETMYLFFDQDENLIYFSVDFRLNENQSPGIMNRLTDSVGEKLAEKYGNSDKEAVPYYKIYDNVYEIFLTPPGVPHQRTRIQFKQLDRFSAYLDYYGQEVLKLENDEIEKTVEKL